MKTENLLHQKQHEIEVGKTKQNGNKNSIFYLYFIQKKSLIKLRRQYKQVLTAAKKLNTMTT